MSKKVKVTRDCILKKGALCDVSFAGGNLWLVQTVNGFSSFPMTVFLSPDNFEDVHEPLTAFSITRKDGTSWSTSMAAGVTLEQAQAYFGPAFVVEKL